MNLRRHLAAGVTSVRDLGGGASCELAKAVEAGVTPGPRVIAAGRALTITGGHGHNVAFAREVDGADGVRKAVREEIRAGAKAIKVVATGGVLTPGIDATFTAFTPEEIGAAVDEAHKWGRPVAAHAIGAPGILGAVRAGVDSVEHCNQLTAEAAREMVARGTFRGPTLCAVRGIVDHPDAVPAYAVAKAREVHDDSMRGLARALRAGVRHVVSTDAGTPFNPHGSAGREVGYLVAWGMPPLQAMVAATANGADLLGLPDARPRACRASSRTSPCGTGTRWTIPPRSPSREWSGRTGSGSRDPRHPFDQLRAAPDVGQLLVREPGQSVDERANTLPPPLREDPPAGRGRLDQHTSRIVGVGTAADEAIALEAVDQAGHRGRRHALGRRQRADPDRTGGDDDRERGQPGRGDAQGVVLRAQATQQVEGRRVEPVGDGLDLSRWGSSP